MGLYGKLNEVFLKFAQNFGKNYEESYDAT